MEAMNINQKKFVRVNNFIHAPQVRVKREDEHLGIMPIRQALDLAYQAGLDLVEINAGSNPPICEIMDYSKFKFEEKKKKREQQAKTKSIASKEIRLRPVSGEHDVNVKIEQLKKFLEDKHPVSVNIMFKYREMAHKDHGFKIMQKILDAIQEVGQSVAPPRFEGSRLSVRLVPKTDKS
jgi:translation initiation factor IF-3